MSRNAIFDALLAFGVMIDPPGEPTTDWADAARVFKDPTSSQIQYPAIYQVEGDCDYQSQLGQLRRREEQVTWVIFHNLGADQSVVPGRYTQDYKDRLDAKFGDTGVRLEALGGIVFAVWIKGAVRRYRGEVDGIEMITVPISLILP